MLTSTTILFQQFQIKSEELLKQLQTETDPFEKTKLQKQLWNCLNVSGTPIIKKQENGKYQIIFLYNSTNAQEVELDCIDLYDRLLGKNGKPKKFKKISATNTFFLELIDVPPDAFIPYSIILNNDKKNPINDPTGKPLFLYQYDLESKKTFAKKTCYVPLTDAKLPSWCKMSITNQLKGSVEKKEFQDFSMSFPERDIWIYKPDPDHFKPENGKVIFMLDGEEFCKTIIPYIDAKEHSMEDFSNTAIVFINSGKYESENPPGRVREYYLNGEKFAKILADEVIPKYSKKLEVYNQQKIILAAHSLAAYPMLEIAATYPDAIGGVLLFSPEILCTKNLPIPNQSSVSQKQKQVPIYMQVGQLEDAIPPEILQGMGEKGQYKLNQSRIEANEKFHGKFTTKEYISPLVVHASGHNEIHVIDGLSKGLQFIFDKQQLKEKSAPTDYNPKQFRK